MRVGNFSVIVPEGKERDTGHIRIAHGQQYRLKLINAWNDRSCDAEVKIDGKDVGAFRISSRGEVVLERPAHDHGKFTFYKADSAEFSEAHGSQVASDERGLIVVTFRPEKQRVRPVGVVRSMGMHAGMEREEKTSGGILDFDSQGSRTYKGTSVQGGETPMQAGVTGLSGHSNQQYINVASLDYDDSEMVVISVRLVADGARVLTPVPNANPVPAPAV